jgi:hypothetical protein
MNFTTRKRDEVEFAGEDKIESGESPLSSVSLEQKLKMPRKSLFIIVNGIPSAF